MSLQDDLRTSMGLLTQAQGVFQSESARHENARTDMISRVNDFVNNIAYRTAVIFEVGADKQYKTIQSVVDLLRNKILFEPVLIKVADGIYDLNSISIDRFPYAHKIRIEGNVKNPEMCTIRWVADSAGNSHGIIINGSKGLNISGFKFVGQTDDGNFTQRSIFLGDESSLYSDSNSLIFDGGHYGIELLDHSLLFADKIRAINVAQSALIGARMSAIYATNLSVKNTVIYNKKAPERLGAFNMLTRGMWLLDNSNAFIAGSSFDNMNNGFIVERGSHIQYSSISLSNCVIGGLAIFGGMAESFNGLKISNCKHGCIADHNSTMILAHASIDNCTTLAVRGDHTSSLYITNSAVKNCGVGYQSINGALLHAVNTTNSGNTVERDVDQYSKLIWS